MKTVSLQGVEVPLVQPERGTPSAVGEAQGESFGELLADAVKHVDQAQLEADGQAQQLAGGGGNLHETMLALEKADVTMKVAVKVRNKVVDAYNEVMRMTV